MCWHFFSLVLVWLGFVPFFLGSFLCLLFWVILGHVWVIWGNVWVILGHVWVILGNVWVILGHLFGSFFVSFCLKFVSLLFRCLVLPFSPVKFVLLFCRILSRFCLSLPHALIFVCVLFSFCLFFFFSSSHFVVLCFCLGFSPSVSLPSQFSSQLVARCLILVSFPS